MCSLTSSLNIILTSQRRLVVSSQIDKDVLQHASTLVHDLADVEAYGASASQLRLQAGQRSKSLLEL